MVDTPKTPSETQLDLKMRMLELEEILDTIWPDRSDYYH